MKLGFRLPHFGPAASPELIRSAAEIAEADGWHSLWTSDRVAVPSDRPGELDFLDDYVQTYESLVTLAFCAAATRRIRLGTSAIVVPQRQLMLFARQVASLDRFSNGRLTLGVAAGWAEAEFVAAGAAARFRTRGRVLDESIEAMRLLWSGGRAAYSGQLVAFPDVDFAPTPVQPGGIPVVVAGNSAAARRRAARLGDGWNPTALGAMETAAGMRDIARWRTEYGRGGSFETIGSLRFDGDVAAARDLLRPYAEIGLDLMICAFHTAMADDVLACLRSFGREVLPAFSV